MRPINFTWSESMNTYGLIQNPYQDPHATYIQYWWTYTAFEAYINDEIFKVVL